MTRRLSYAEKGKAIASSSSTTTLRRIRAPEIDTTRAIRENELTLIGRVTNPKEQKIWDLIPYLIQRWNLKGAATGSELGQHCFQFRFELKEDMETVLSKRPYQYARWMLIIQRWEPIISADFPAKIPFWIKLKGLPLHYWDPEMLERLGKEAGRLDNFELTPTSARILVTVNGLQPLLMETIVDFSTGEETIVTLEYEKLANHCSSCKRLSHGASECPYNRSPSPGEHSIAPQRQRTNEPPGYQRNYATERHRTGTNHRNQEVRNQQELPHFNQRLDRHGRPFGTRPSAKHSREDPRQNRQNLSPRRPIRSETTHKRSESPVDSHTYRRERPLTSATQQEPGKAPAQHALPPPPRTETRRRSLSFGARGETSNLIWKEKNPTEYTEHISTPHTSPGLMLTIADMEKHKQLHEEILNELQVTTIQYVNVSDPVERAARRQRVLDGEVNNLMAETAAAMLTRALQAQGQLQPACNTTLEIQNPIGEEPNPVEIELPLAAPPKRRGRPPGGTTKKPNAMMGAGSRKRKIQAIQNSPKVRKTSGNPSIATDAQPARRQSAKNRRALGPRPLLLPPATTNRAPAQTTFNPPVTTPPAAPAPTTTPNRRPEQNRSETTNREKSADFQNPQNSVP